MTQLRVGVVQFAPSANAADNRDELRVAMDALSDVDLIVLPEYSAWYHENPSSWPDGADAIDGDFVRFLGDAARVRGVTIIAGFLVRHEDTVRNSVVIVDGSGLRGRYDKVHLYDAFGARESDVVTAGDPVADPLVFDLFGLRIGVQTCYDIRFPEVSRRLIDAGVTVLVVPSDWVPGPRKIDHWETLLRARAIENISWVVAANHAEPSGVGHSMIVSPVGDVVTRADSTSTILRATLVSDEVVTARRTNPALDLRRFRVVPS